MKHKNINWIILLLFTFILASSIVVTADTAEGGWVHPGYDYQRSYNNYDESGFFGEYENLYTGIRSDDYTPIVIDWDLDGYKDIVTMYSGSQSLNIYDSSLDLVEEYVLGGTPSAGMDTTDSDDDNYSEINTIFNTSTSIYDFYSIEYNGTTFITNCHNQTNKTPTSAVSCYDDICYHTTTSGDIVEIYLDNCTYDVIDLSPLDTFRVTNADRMPIAFVDINLDGDIEAIMPSNLTTWLPFAPYTYSRIAVYDTEDDVLLSSFGTGGFSPEIVGHMTGFSVGQLDKVGTPEIVFITTQQGLSVGASTEFMGIYNSVGTQIFVETLGDTGVYDGAGVHISNPVILDSDMVNTRPSISFVYNASSVTYIYNDTGYQRVSNITSGNRTITMYNDIAYAEIDLGTSIGINYSNVSEIYVQVPAVISGGTIFSPPDNNYSYSVDIPYNYKEYSVLATDMDNDGIPDIIGYTQDGLFLSVSNTQNNPPTINNSMRYGGYGSVPAYTSPICVNSSITFQAGDVGDRYDGNYWNDYIEQERLITDCGLGSDNYTGNYSYNSPSVTCEYNQTGDYVVTIYVEDISNEGDRTAYNYESILVRVITGTPGSTCSLDSTDIGGTSIIGGTGDTDMSGFDDTINSFAGTSLSFRLILAVSLIIFVTAGVVSRLSRKGVRGNALVIVAMVTAIMATIGLTALGLLPVYILILIMITGILVWVYKNFVVGGGTSS